MATRTTRGRMPEGGRAARWTRQGSPLWGSAIGLLRALILLVVFYAGIMYLMVMIGGYASLDDAQLAESAEVAVNLAPFLVTGMALLAVAVFVSMRVAALLSGIMLALGALLALFPGDDSASLVLVLFSEEGGVATDAVASRFVDLVMLAGPPAVTMGLSLASIRLNRTRWHDDRDRTMPRQLTWAALIGIGYGWFYTGATLNPSYLLIALASLVTLRWWQRYAVWVAGFTAFVGTLGLIMAIDQGPPERLFHRLPWAIAALGMVPLARHGVRRLDVASPTFVIPGNPLVIAAAIGIAFTITQSPFSTIVMSNTAPILIQLPLVPFSLAIPKFPRRALWPAGAIVLAAILNLAAAVSDVRWNTPAEAISWLGMTLFMMLLVRNEQGNLNRQGSGPSAGERGTPEHTGPNNAATHSMTDSSQHSSPVPDDAASSATDPLRWFGRPDRYKRAGDQSDETEADT